MILFTSFILTSPISLHNTLENLQSPDTVRKSSILVTAHNTHANNKKVN